MINADDWGRDRDTTNRIVDCIRVRAVPCVSAMVFMADSERAAELARETAVDAGLHLNLTTPFSAPHSPNSLTDRQQRISRYLRSNPLARVTYHPGLGNSFEYVVKSQLDEFCRIYGRMPARIDGHHHMHLCTNVLIARLLPAGVAVRRNFSFRPGEKPWWNRLYRRAVDRMLERRHPLTDFLFSLPPLEPSRLQRIFSLANQFAVEVETHPVNHDEYQFLTSAALFARANDVVIASGVNAQSGRRVISK